MSVCVSVCCCVLVWGRRGFTRQPENSKRAHFRTPALQTPPKFHEKTPRERRKNEIFQREREKKARNFRPPTLWALPFLSSGPLPFGPPPLRAPTPSGPPSKVPPCPPPDPPTTPTTPPQHPHNKHPTTKKMAQFGQIRFVQMRPNKDGQIRFGPMRSRPAGSTQKKRQPLVRGADPHSTVRRLWCPETTNKHQPS